MDRNDVAAEPGRRGAVGVVFRAGRMLVIRRAENVAAPGAYCFPGGGIEGNETDEEALVREIREELGVEVRPVKPLWRSVTPWQVDLSWWLADLDDPEGLRPNPAEVQSVCWVTIEEMARLPDLLGSNRQFLEAFRRGEFELPVDFEGDLPGKEP